VFNCDEGIDVKSMGRIFVGLIKCGAWGCFDEFNRLEEQTLSAVSMQIQPIQVWDYFILMIFTCFDGDKLIHFCLNNIYIFIFL
jgi:hypothetical protein